MGQWSNRFTKPITYEQSGNLSASTGLASIGAGIPKNVSKAWIQAQSNSVRWRDDGGTPTASVGMILAAGDILEYTGDLSAIRFIQTAASAQINITYYE